MAYYEIACKNRKCKFLNDIAETLCSKCGRTITDTPNVKRAKLISEQLALKQRYKDAKCLVDSKGLNTELQKFELCVLNEGKAIINIDFNFLWKWLITGGVEYKSYQRQIYEGLRKKAKWAYDVKRCIVDACLFGSDIEVIYSALSINETGLTTYGQISVIMDTKSIEMRTSCLEENSFNFIKAVLGAGYDLDSPLPAGKFAPWQKRHQLATIKCHKKFYSNMTVGEVQRLILRTGDDRSTDDFIELYIYGKIVKDTVEKIRISSVTISQLDSKQKIQLEELANHFKVEIY